VNQIDRARKRCRADLRVGLRESEHQKTILGLIVLAVFALGLFPDEPMRKTELAAKSYQQLVSTPRLPAKTP
jgi:hypothetical protein